MGGVFQNGATLNSRNLKTRLQIEKPKQIHLTVSMLHGTISNFI